MTPLVLVKDSTLVPSRPTSCGPIPWLSPLLRTHPEQLDAVYDQVANGWRVNMLGDELERPDLIAVDFSRGDEGGFRALSDNELVPHGVLEDYTVDADALTMSGTAEFGWFNEDGEADLDSLHPGTFQVTC